MRIPTPIEPAYDRDQSPSGGLSRRSFLQMLGAGLLITVTGPSAPAQRRGGPRQPLSIASRLHIAEDGTVTVMTGKVELGQGARTEVAQAAAEELRVPITQISVIVADTDLVPNDGVTAGSRTTPGTIPAVRQGAAAARGALVALAAREWQVDAASLTVAEGVIAHPPTQRHLTYGDLAKADTTAEALQAAIPDDVAFTPVADWQVLGVPTARLNARDLVTGAHRYAADMALPDMLHGRVLRPPAYGARLTALDTAPAEALEGVKVVRDGDFVGCTAPTAFQAAQAVELLANSATWETTPQPSSAELWDHFRTHLSGDAPARDDALEAALAAAAHTLNAEYHTAYLQHAPMEPGAALAEWKNDHLTVWLGSRDPFGERSRLVEAFGLSPDRVRVVVPDTGGGFGMKSGDFVGLEAARLAKAAGRPVHLQWTREEEFTWAYYRPAALITLRAGLDANGAITAWDFTNINSGGSAINTPYAIPHARANYQRSDSPLRGGSYRALAATANNFARECGMDELATLAGADPLAFRLAHLQDARLQAVLQAAAERFGWERRKASDEGIGFGLACGTEKASYVAACAEVAVDRQKREIHVRRACEVFECGTVLNPANLRAQVCGCVTMGLGAVLREEVQFADGRILNPRFSQYLVPRFADVPELHVHLLNRPDIDPAGGGETPLIAIGPAVANAVFDAVGVRVREMPIKLPPA